MTKLSRIDFVKKNKDYIQKIFTEILDFINNQDELDLRNKETFRLNLINYLYNMVSWWFWLWRLFFVNIFRCKWFISKYKRNI